MPMISRSTRTRPRWSRCSRRQRVAPNCPDIMRTFWPTSRPPSGPAAPPFSREETNPSTTPRTTGSGCSAPMINEATPDVPLTLRHRYLERSMIVKIYPGKRDCRVSRDLRACRTVRRNLGTKLRKLNRWRLNCTQFCLVREHSRVEPTLSPPQFQTIEQTSPQVPLALLLLLLPKTNFSFGQATAIWVKRRFAHDEIFRLLAEQRGKRRPCREAQPTMLYQKRQVVLYNFG